MKRNLTHTAFLLFATVITLQAAGSKTCDIVVYGGTSAGITAAIQAKKEGKSVLLIEPTGRLGGMSTNGLGQTDIGNKQVIGGLAREFYEKVHAYYQNPAAWKWQKTQDYRDGSQTRTDRGESTMWTFEPGAALAIFEKWVADSGVEVVFRERLDREKGVVIRGSPPRIESITMESGRTFRGRMFIDATYEGDLMAAAGVTHTVGRESNAQYGESCNGVCTRLSTSHNIWGPVDPYITPGDPASGLLPFIDPDGPGRVRPEIPAAL
jgi:flavin-dependent dehydrogenase